MEVAAEVLPVRKGDIQKKRRDSGCPPENFSESDHTKKHFHNPAVTRVLREAWGTDALKPIFD